MEEFCSGIQMTTHPSNIRIYAQYSDQKSHFFIGQSSANRHVPQLCQFTGAYTPTLVFHGVSMYLIIMCILGYTSIPHVWTNPNCNAKRAPQIDQLVHNPILLQIQNDVSTTNPHWRSHKPTETYYKSSIKSICILAKFSCFP